MSISIHATAGYAPVPVDGPARASADTRTAGDRPPFMDEYCRYLAKEMLYQEIMKPSQPEEGETWQYGGESW